MSRLFIGTFAILENYELLKYELEPFFEGRWVKEENLHITFKFLGDVQNVNLIIKKLKNISYPKKQTIIFKRFRLFNKKVLALRSSNKTLYKLQNTIEEYLQDDFEKEIDFKPHITLMRIKKIKNDSYKEKFKTLNANAVIKLKLCLVQSELDVGGAKYKIIKKF